MKPLKQFEIFSYLMVYWWYCQCGYGVLSHFWGSIFVDDFLQEDKKWNFKVNQKIGNKRYIYKIYSNFT